MQAFVLYNMPFHRFLYTNTVYFFGKNTTILPIYSTAPLLLHLGGEVPLVIACKKRITEQEPQWEILSLGMKVLSVQVGLSDAYCLGPREKKETARKSKSVSGLAGRSKRFSPVQTKKAGAIQLNCESLTLLLER